MELKPSDNPNAAPAAQNQLVRQDRDQARPGKGMHPLLRGLTDLPIARQVGVMLGLALSVAIGVAVVLWSQAPDYRLLFGSLTDQEMGEVLEALGRLNADYKIESSSGALLVPADKLHELRLKLASQGLPRTSSQGFELLEKETGFGVSQALEKARFQRALEGEIGRSIMTIQNVKSARVHLALPKQSVFIRNRKKPSASVLINLYPGRHLEKGQVEAIIHLVASSVPQLEPEQVTVVDQRGHLLNAPDSANGLYLTSKQFEYKKQVEEHLMERVENILSPLVGRDGLRAQVTAELDFALTERTQELFNPDSSALRSEQIQEEQNRLAGAQGVPGALSNQPPAAGSAPEIAAGQDEGENRAPLSMNKSATRNYELDKTISHTRSATGVLRRLTVAVVIDDKRAPQEEGGLVNQPYTQEELDRFTALVQEAVGFDANRNDRVTVTNVAFKSPESIEPLPALPLWEQSGFWSLSKQLGAVLVILFLLFGVLRPALRGLMAHGSKSAERERSKETGRSVSSEEGEGRREKQGNSHPEKGLAEDKLTLGREEETLLLEAPQNYEKRLEYARKMVDGDPKRVAQVMKTWVARDG